MCQICEDRSHDNFRYPAQKAKTPERKDAETSQTAPTVGSTTCSRLWPGFFLRYLAFALLGFTATSASALDVRPASEEEIATVLIGCWSQEPTPEVLYFESIGISSKHTLCFRAGGEVSVEWLGGDDTLGWEAGGDDGSFTLGAGKLLLISLGNYLSSEHVSCDVVMGSRYAKARFENCVGSGPYPNGMPQDPAVVDNMSFSRVIK